MHLPGPLRAAVGLVATAASEARHLPDRAVELPMLAVSSALQASLRAQQRYARLAARGDEVLNRRVPTEEPPPWATFDDPVPLDNLRRATALGPGNGEPATGSMFGQLFGVEDPTAPVDGREPVGEVLPADEPVPAPAPAKKTAKRAVTKAAEKTGKTAPGQTATEQSAVKKSATKKSATKKSATKKSATAESAAGPAAKAIHRETSKPAKKAARKAATRQAAKKAARKSGGTTVQPTGTPAPGATGDRSAAGGSKAISKPRHTAPSAFDNVDD